MYFSVIEFSDEYSLWIYRPSHVSNWLFAVLLVLNI
jgi:hypothetical protein